MLIHASKNGDVGLVRAMIAEGLDVKSSDFEGNTALLFAAYAGHEDVARLLLDAGALVDAKSTEPLTPLLASAAAGHEGVVRLLISRGASIAARDAFNWTPLMRAAEAGHEGVVSALREAGASEPAEPPPPPPEGSPIDTTAPGYFPFNGQGGIFGFYAQGIVPPARLARPPGSAFASDSVRGSVAASAELRRAKDFSDVDISSAERRRRDELASHSAAIQHIAGVPVCAPPAQTAPLQMNPFEIIEKIPTGDAVRIFERIGIVSLDDPYRRPGHIGFRFSARDGAGADGAAGVGGGNRAAVPMGGLSYGLHSYHPLLSRLPPTSTALPPLISPPGAPPPPFIPYTNAMAEARGVFPFRGEGGGGTTSGGGAAAAAGGYMLSQVGGDGAGGPHFVYPGGGTDGSGADAGYYAFTGDAGDGYQQVMDDDADWDEDGDDEDDGGFIRAGDDRDAQMGEGVTGEGVTAEGEAGAGVGVDADET